MAKNSVRSTFPLKVLSLSFMHSWYASTNNAANKGRLYKSASSPISNTLD